MEWLFDMVEWLVEESMSSFAAFIQNQCYGSVQIDTLSHQHIQDLTGK